MNQADRPERGLSVVAGVVTALAVVALCGAGGFLFGQHRAQKAKRGWNLVPAVMAARDLPAGTSLKRGDLVETRAPEQFVTAQIQRSASGLEGRPLLAPIAKGELVHVGHLSPPVSRACLDQTITTAVVLGIEANLSVKALLADLNARSAW